MKLTIIITHHNEPQDVYKKLMESLNSQYINEIEKHLEIIISNNCELPFQINIEPYTNIYRCIKFVYPDRKNSLSYSRQYALDRCTGDFVTFCDCDDYIALNTFVALFNSIVKQDVENRINVYKFQILNEVSYKHSIYGIISENMIEVWGNIYRTKFLWDNNIRFDSRLQFNEDREFNAHCCNCCNDTQIASVPIMYYTHTNNQNSTTNSTKLTIKIRDLLLCTNSILSDYENFRNDHFYRNYTLAFMFSTLISNKDNDIPYDYFYRIFLCILQKFDPKLSFIEYACNSGSVDGNSVVQLYNDYNSSDTIDFKFDTLYGSDIYE